MIHGVKRPVKPDETPRPRGRPRSTKARSAILRAARELLAEGGPAAVTMEGVASRAGVGKPTVYRWWPDRHAVAMAALMEGEAPRTTRRAPRSALLALRQQLRTIAERFAAPTGRHVATMIAASDLETEFSKAFRNHFVLARRAEGRALARAGDSRRRGPAGSRRRGRARLALWTALLPTPHGPRLAGRALHRRSPESRAAGPDTEEIVESHQEILILPLG